MKMNSGCTASPLYLLSYLPEGKKLASELENPGCCPQALLQKTVMAAPRNNGGNGAPLFHTGLLRMPNVLPY